MTSGWVACHYDPIDFPNLDCGGRRMVLSKTRLGTIHLVRACRTPGLISILPAFPERQRPK
jgi:hypothetical protein